MTEAIDYLIVLNSIKMDYVKSGQSSRLNMTELNDDVELYWELSGSYLACLLRDYFFKF